jgi:hypothetical protein
MVDALGFVVGTGVSGALPQQDGQKAMCNYTWTRNPSLWDCCGAERVPSRRPERVNTCLHACCDFL